MKIKKKSKFGMHYKNRVYFINFILLLSLFLLKVLDVYYSYILISYDLIEELNPLGQILLSSSPFILVSVSFLPIIALFLLNYVFRKEFIYLISLSVFFIFLNIILIFVLQNNLAVMQEVL